MPIGNPGRSSSLEITDLQNNDHQKSHHITVSEVALPTTSNAGEKFENENNDSEDANIGLSKQPVRQSDEESTSDADSSSGGNFYSLKGQSKRKTKTKDKSKHKIGFDPGWKKNRPWLKTEVVMKDNASVLGMYCEICRSFNLKGGNGSLVWSKLPCMSLRLDRLSEHENGQMHREAMILLQSKKLAVPSTFESSANVSAIIGAMRCLELLIRHNVPNTTFYKPMLEFMITMQCPDLQPLNCSGNAKYTSPAIQNEFSEAMAQVCRSELLDNLRKSPAASLLIDETTDLSVRKHLAFSVKYIDSSGEVTTTFLENVSLPNGTAETITERIYYVCKQLNLPLSTFQSSGTDGCNTMTGKKNWCGEETERLCPSL